jgi:hypothetical protein
VAEAGRAAFISGLRWASAVAIVVALVGAVAAWRLLPAGTSLAATADPAQAPAPAPAAPTAGPPTDRAAA